MRRAKLAAGLMHGVKPSAAIGPMSHGDPPEDIRLFRCVLLFVLGDGGIDNELEATRGYDIYESIPRLSQISNSPLIRNSLVHVDEERAIRCQYTVRLLDEATRLKDMVEYVLRVCAWDRTVNSVSREQVS